MTQSPRQSLFCRRCGTGVRAKDRECTRCGTPAGTENSSSARPTTGARCVRCGEEALRHAKFCARCGNNFEQRKSPPIIPPTPPVIPPTPPVVTHGPPKPAVAQSSGSGCLVTILIAIAIGGVQYYRKQTAPKPAQHLTTLPTFQFPKITQPKITIPNAKASISDIRSKPGVFDADGFLGMQLTARIQIPGGGRGQLIARATPQDGAGAKMRIITIPVNDQFGVGADYSVVFAHDSLARTAGDNGFDVELSLLNSAGVQIASVKEIEGNFTEDFTALRRVRIFTNQRDNWQRPGVTFKIDFVFASLVGNRGAVGVRFRDATGQYLKTTDKNNIDAGGNLITWREAAIPNGDRPVVRDVELFLPYANLPNNASQLTAEVSFWDPQNNKSLAKSLKFDVRVR